MRIQAICHACGREFLFFQLYHADPWQADRCPHCSAYLGIRHIRALAVAGDRALTALVGVLERLGEGRLGFTVDPASLLARLEAAVDVLAAQDAGPREQPATVTARQDLAA